MKLRSSFFLLTTLFISSSKAQQSREEMRANMRPIIIINNNLDQKNATANQAHAISSSNPVNQLTNDINLNTIQNHIIKTFKTGAHYAREEINHLKETIVSYKYRFIAATLIALFAYLCWQSYCGAHYCEQPLLWSSWKSDVTLEQLLAIDQAQLARELMMALEMRYMNNNNPTDFFTPVTNFTRDIDYEVARLNYYETLFCWINRLHLSRITFGKQSLVIQFQQRRQRLVYLKNLCKQWVIEYNLKKKRNLNPNLLTQKASQPLYRFPFDLPTGNFAYLKAARLIFFLSVATLSTGVLLGSYCSTVYGMPQKLVNIAQYYKESIRMNLIKLQQCLSRQVMALQNIFV